MTTKKITVTYTDAEDNEIEESLTVPARWCICGRCEGQGKHSNPSIDGNGITESEMEEAGADFREDYFAGRYDVGCEECAGSGKILEVDGERFENTQPEAYKRWVAEEAADREYEAESRWERKMGY
jgi:hypothetical protein